MRIRLFLCFLAITLYASISAVNAKRLSNNIAELSTPKSDRISQLGSISRSYRSPGKLHKAVVSDDDSESLARAMAEAPIEIADYGSFKLLTMDESALRRSEEIPRSSPISSISDTAASFDADEKLMVRDDLNLLLLRSGVMDTTDADTPGSFSGMGRSASSFGLQAATPK